VETDCEPLPPPDSPWALIVPPVVMMYQWNAWLDDPALHVQ